MKQENFKRKDGSEGTKYSLEAGDVFTPKFNTPRETKAGQYTNYSLGIKDSEGQDMFIQLTKGQAEKIKKLGEVEGKTMTAYEYTNEHGKQVGVALKE